MLKTAEQDNIRIIENIGTPIKNLFNIAVGIATLKDEIFFVDSSNEENGYLIKNTEKGTFYIERKLQNLYIKFLNSKTKMILSEIR